MAMHIGHMIGDIASHAQRSLPVARRHLASARVTLELTASLARGGNRGPGVLTSGRRGGLTAAASLLRGAHLCSSGSSAQCRGPRTLEPMHRRFSSVTFGRLATASNGNRIGGRRNGGTPHDCTAVNWRFASAMRSTKPCLFAVDPPCRAFGAAAPESDSELETKSRNAQLPRASKPARFEPRSQIASPPPEQRARQTASPDR